MAEKSKKGNPIVEYISGQPKNVREILLRLRELILEEVPDAEELMKYRMPTFFRKENLVHFAAYAHHIGFYPTPSAIAKFSREFTGYTWARGSIQFPLDKPFPFDLVRKMVRFRVAEVAEKIKAKERSKTPRAQVLFQGLAAPARRALSRAGISGYKELSGMRERELRELHGIGPSAVQYLRSCLKEAGLDFRK
jgi:uncharacterized protein YdhG (YjbR/CyaY superfamily)